jgi:prepilin-type N-terminal cleavage/methylation domain-containing protein
MAMDGRTRAARARGQSGMTLLELMIVLAIMSVASGAMFSLLFASFKTYWRGDAATQAQQGARIGLDRMTRDLRQARRFINGVTETIGSTSVTFNTGCTTPQISMALPHLGNVTLSDGSTIYATDANASGTVPYDGTYVSYYLAAATNSATPNTTGPYLIRASYDLVANTITLSNVARNITGLGLSAGGSCPTTATRELTLTLTALQNQTGEGVSSTTILKDDVAVRNQ